MKRFLIFIVILVIFGSAGAFIFTSVAIPDFEALKDRKVIQSTKIYDRTDTVLLYDVHSDIKRTVVPFEKIPQNLKNATLSIEDSGFYHHRGVSFASIMRSIIINLLSGEFQQGGSTITQQLVKNTFLTREKTIIRKAKELVLAIKVESVYEKDKILELYLNEIPYGGSNYGVQAASQSYFGKQVEELTLAESAYLAALPQSPTRYSPFGSHLDELEARKNLVLERMFQLGFISEDEMRSAKEEQVRFINAGLESIKAPHFVLYLKEYLVDKYGEDVVENGGLRVVSTLNWDWQQKAEELVKQYGDENETKFNAWNAGLVALDPKTGEILTMVGSRDYFGAPGPAGCNPGINCRFDPKVNTTLRARQPGSSIKPFVYATAFKKGYTPDTMVFDLPTEFSPLCDSNGTPGSGVREDVCYHPQNYDDKFRGPISLREALAQSVNVPSVKVLYLAGLAESLKTALQMGINTLDDPARYGLTLVLGGGEVKLLELTGGYSVFANDGLANRPSPVLKITDSNGKIMEESRPQNSRALEENVARMISDVLSDNKARTPAFGDRSFLYFPERPVAVKTGTTNDYRDAWVLGYTPNVAAGVWVGNSDNTSMEKKVAGFIAAPLWNAFLSEIFKELPIEEFKKPTEPEVNKPVLKGEWRGGRVYKIDKISGKLATEFTPEELVEEKAIREVHSILYWINKDDPLGPALSNPSSDPQFRNWETIVRSWAFNAGLTDQDDNAAPREYDDLHRPEFAPSGSIFLNPGSAAYEPGTRLMVTLQLSGRFQIDQVDLFVGSRYAGTIKSAPFSSNVTIEGSPGEEIEISAQVYDIVRNKTTISKIVRISGN